MDSYIHPRVGNIVIRRSKKARRISITVKPDNVYLTVPLRVSVEEAKVFADSKADWIIKALNRIRSRATRPEIIRPPFSTRLFTLKFSPSENGKLYARINGRELIVYISALLTPDSKEVQSMIRTGLTECFRREAKALLPQRVDELAKHFGFQYSGLAFRNTVSRWGSCSVSNSISLSTNLMRLPDHLIDYIILHELCHTVHKNHGEKFHQMLNSITQGKHYDLRAELKKHSARW